MDTSPPPSDFIRDIIAADIASGRYGGRVVTRFPPEPNGYLHIGHAKSICLNFGIAAENAGAVCHLRFDDTNPAAEDMEFVESIKADLRWLGFDWGEHLYFASDYFDRLYEYALRLIELGYAYVCDLSSEEVRANRGTLTEAGNDSPYRERSIAENLDLFARMKAGEFDNGSRTLRAKIDMASPVIVMRDPVLYRIQKMPHYRAGGTWSIYPMYDFAHCLSDSIERVTHSLCTLEFADNRALYDWVLEKLEIPSPPRQIEFARLNLSHTVMSKRILRCLVDEGHVDGWDDPRMPTISGMRRRGYPPSAIRKFCEGVGIARSYNLVQAEQLEAAVREELNRSAPRVMGVLDPLRVVIENYPEGPGEEFEAINNPEDDSAGTRKVPFSRVLYIEKADFMEDPPRKFYRLAPGREVRLRYAYFITCIEVIKDEQGEVVELRCSYDPESYGGNSPDGRKVKATLHWVSAAHAVEAEFRLYGRLLKEADPATAGAAEDMSQLIDPESLRCVAACPVEPGLATAVAGTVYQFERIGYFCVDRDSAPGTPVFNRTVGLRDTWARMQKAGKG